MRLDNGSLIENTNGWVLPAASTNIDLSCGTTTEITVRYAVVPPRLLVDYQEGLRLYGTTGTVYRIETNASPHLTNGWRTFSTNFLPTSGLVITNTRPMTSTGTRFYRAVWGQ